MRYPVDVFTGKVRDYTGGRPSAIAKVQIDGEPMLTELGLMEGKQAETKIHGGSGCALCRHPREYCQYRRQTFPERVELFVAPAFSENLSTEGLTEENVYVDDIFQQGEVLIQVTQPRSPCSKLNFHSDISDMASQIQDVGETDWLYSVIAPGQALADAPLILTSRVSDVSVQEAIAIAWYMPFDDSQYHRLLSTVGLSRSWTRTM